jgi:hypothetical protein
LAGIVRVLREIDTAERARSQDTHDMIPPLQDRARR